MPEGPEVWLLSKAINKFYNDKNKTYTIGKHLIIEDVKEDWSFGLTGKVEIDVNGNLHKLESGWLYGEKKHFNNGSSKDNMGIDWMQTNKTELEKVINKWKTSKKKLGSLLLDQSEICGIGVAWGSEILYVAKLKPNLKASEQSLDNLADAMLEIRKEIKTVYEGILTKMKSKEHLKILINGWYKNLYEVRIMNVYKKGIKIQVSGRSWWV